MSHKLNEIIKNMSVDCVIFGFENNVLEVLLVQRAIQPGKGEWALPGGFIKKEEIIQDAVQRVLTSTTGVSDIYLEQVAVFDKVDRYPLWRVFTIAYFALISPKQYALMPGIDTSEVRWFRLSELPELQFDHLEIVNSALAKLRTRIRTRPIGFELLSKKFTLPELQNLYEEILGHAIDKRNFRKKVIKLNLLKKLKEVQKNQKRGRSAALYMFDKNNYRKLKNNGLVFDL